MVQRFDAIHSHHAKRQQGGNGSGAPDPCWAFGVQTALLFAQSGDKLGFKNQYLRDFGPPGCSSDTFRQGLEHGEHCLSSVASTS